MNIKMSFALLASLFAASASAQVTAILPGGRGNLYIGAPTTLPGPLSGITINPRINLPASPLTASMVPVLSPVPTAAAVPLLPAVAVPQHRIVAERENVALAYPALHPRFAAPAKDASVKDDASSRERLDGIFDGRKRPAEKGVSDEFSPVRSDRHHGLPENDLEREIGAY